MTTKKISGGAGQGEGNPLPGSPAGYETARPARLDSANHFRVVGRGDGQIGVYALPIQHLSPAQAVNLAAWLVAIADPGRTEFDRVYAEITR